jgi:hypothetical protein
MKPKTVAFWERAAVICSVLALIVLAAGLIVPLFLGGPVGLKL